MVKQRFAKIILNVISSGSKSHIRLLNDYNDNFSEQKMKKNYGDRKKILDVKNVLYELLQEEK